MIIIHTHGVSKHPSSTHEVYEGLHYWGNGTGKSILSSAFKATTNLLTKLYPPTVATVSTICLSLINCFKALNTFVGTFTSLVMWSANSKAEACSGVSEVFWVAGPRKGGKERISRSCWVVNPAARPSGSCCILNKEYGYAQIWWSNWLQAYHWYDAPFSTAERRI